MGCYCSAEGNETGITHTQPRQQAKHMYRATMKVGPTPKTEAEVGGVLSRLVDDWPGSAYNPTSKNCLHFCNEFCKELELGCIPGWIDHIDHSSSSIKKFPSKGMLYKKQAKGTMTVELEAAMKAVRDQGQPPRTPRSRQDTRSNFSNNLLRLGHDLIAAAAQALGESPAERKDRCKLRKSRIDRKERVHSLQDAIRNRGGITLAASESLNQLSQRGHQCVEGEREQVPKPKASETLGVEMYCVTEANVEIPKSSVGLPITGLEAAGSLEVPVSNLEMPKSSLPCACDGKEDEAKTPVPLSLEQPSPHSKPSHASGAEVAENELADTAFHEDDESETEMESSEWEEDDEDGEEPIPGLHPAAPKFMKHICRAFPTITEALDLSDENLVKELAAPFLEESEDEE